MAAFRIEAGRNPDKGLTDLIGELATRRDAFRILWAAHEVRLGGGGEGVEDESVVGGERHHLVGEGEVANDGVVDALGSPTADALNLLASWATPAPSRPPTDQHAARSTGAEVASCRSAAAPGRCRTAKRDCELTP